MDALINWGATFVTAHPKVAGWLLTIMAIDQVLKMLKNALKLNVDDNIFDTIGNLIGKILEKSNTPKP